ncbi:MAG: Bpu10I family restriction endonuclease [Cyanobacterium sp. T60_A2020_053]|nr:Bpu10I family restriction endonuclease [Cyanobacterium sp. T60_A2020_053]
MYVHGHNLKQKETHKTKYTDPESRQFLQEIRIQYDKWKRINEKLKGAFSQSTDQDIKIIKRRVKLLNIYKNFLDQQKYAEKFDSRSNLHSSVLEEFTFYLFKDLVYDISPSTLLGKANTFKDIFFRPSSYQEMVTKPNVRLETKDHDFVIGIDIKADLICFGSQQVETHHFQIPAVAIECKTYLDKTMLEGASNAAEQLKLRNPNAIYIIVAEWLKLTDSINLQKFKVDQIYVLRKQKNTDREFRYLETYLKNPIYDDVVIHLFEIVRKHLTTDWEKGLEQGLDRGYLIL